jgi:hypothetical protein
MVIGHGVEKKAQLYPRFGLAEPKKKIQPSSPSHEEGRCLVVGFLGIKDAAIRDTIIDLTEKISQTYDDLR